MNQLTVDTRTRKINILEDDVRSATVSTKFMDPVRTKTYTVVKFMVNVKLMEKSVKSHVGSVIVEKVMIQ